MIHQAYELWFKQLLFELESIRACLFDGDTRRARHYLRRVHTIDRLLIEQIPILETMSPQEFLEFRHNLRRHHLRFVIRSFSQRLCEFLHQRIRPILS